MNENNNLTIVPKNGTLVLTSEGFIDHDNYPNFIESNTKAVTTEELSPANIPTGTYLVQWNRNDRQHTVKLCKK